METLPQILEDIKSKGYNIANTEKINKGFRNDLFKITQKNGQKAILKIFEKSDWRSKEDRCKAEIQAYEIFRNRIPVPNLYAQARNYILLEYLTEQSFVDLIKKKEAIASCKKTVDQSAHILAKIHSVKCKPDENGLFDRLFSDLSLIVSKVPKRTERKMLEDIIKTITKSSLVDDIGILDGNEFTHGDYKYRNLLVSEDSIMGVIDWENSGFSSHYIDLGAYCSLLPHQMVQEFLEIYKKDSGKDVNIRIMEFFTDYFYIRDAAKYLVYGKLLKLGHRRGEIESALLGKLKAAHNKYCKKVA
jgi:thiamine kinase-like enzyme